VFLGGLGGFPLGPGQELIPGDQDAERGGHLEQLNIGRPEEDQPLGEPRYAAGGPH
jgi:hypothetical protein